MLFTNDQETTLLVPFELYGLGKSTNEQEALLEVEVM